MVQLNAAESNRAQIRIIKEAVWGTTPSTGVTKQVRLTGSGLEASKETKTSDEIRADRMTSGIIEVGASSSGPIEFEMSAGAVDDFLESFVLGAWTVPVNYFQIKGTSVRVTDVDTITLAGGDFTNYITVGGYIKLEGFLNAANNGYFEVATAVLISGSTVVEVVGALVVENGTALSKFLDAGDVLLAADTVTFGADNTLDGGGANAFDGVVVGQKLWIEGLGKAVGAVQFDVADPPEGSTVTIGDTVNEELTFEFRTNPDLVGEANVHVALSGTPGTQAASLAAAVMRAFRERKFEISATVATDTVTLTNHKQVAGGVLTASDAGSTNLTAFTGGSATKSGFFTVASVIDNDSLTTEETLTVDANAGDLLVVIKGSHLRNPGDITQITKQSFTIETGFTDVSKFFVMDGMRAGSFAFAVEAGELVTGSVEFMGRRTTRSSTERLGNAANYTVLDATSTEVLNATSNVGVIKKDGVPLELGIKSIEINGDANLREQRIVGSKFPGGIGYGRFTLEGSFQAHFETFEQYDVFINHTTTSLSFPFTDVDSNTYYFTIPAIKYKSDPIKPEGVDQDVMEDIEWEAQRDPVLNTQFMVDRFSSVWPFTA